VLDILPKFTGKISQTPPIYSALKQDGKKLYEYAREGKAPPREIKAREVVIHKLDLVRFTHQNAYATDAPIFEIDVECGGGTYIRSLIRDMATSLDSTAHMVALTRTRQGDFTLRDALPLDTVSLESISAALHPV
jgi:tRNA pseudouridine55 synthase